MSNPNQLCDILSIGAHPDDAEVFSGGAIIKAVNAGRRVGVISLTRGEMGTRGTVEERAMEAARAAELMGVEHELLDLPDGSLADIPEQRSVVASLLRRRRPRLVLTHAPKDRHPDHDSAHRLVRSAKFLANLGNAGIEGERHLVDRLAFFFGNHEPDPPTPDVVVDVSAEFEKKLEAMKAYATQVAGSNNPPPGPYTYIASPEYWKWTETRARYYGKLIDVEFGEPFLFDGPIPLGQIDDLLL